METTGCEVIGDECESGKSWAVVNKLKRKREKTASEWIGDEHEVAAMGATECEMAVEEMKAAEREAVKKKAIGSELEMIERELIINDVEAAERKLAEN